VVLVRVRLEFLAAGGSSSELSLAEAFPHSKAHPAGLRAATQVTHLVLSGTMIRRKRHESVMSSVMNGKSIT
jgi:hypothetical protein